MKLSKNINNNFDSIFEKKSSESIESETSKDILKENIFYEKILEKTVSFRNELLEKPKTFLKSLFDKKINIPFIKISCFSALFTIIGYAVIKMPANVLFFLVSITELAFFATIVMAIIEICFFKKNKKTFIESIDNISTINNLLNSPKDMLDELEGNIVSEIYYKNKEEFENSLNSINNYRDFKKEDLDLFLKSFNKEEITFISTFLLERFKEDVIEATVLDDLVSFLENKLRTNNKVNEEITKENKFKSFMSEYVETEEISNKKLLKSLL